MKPTATSKEKGVSLEPSIGMAIGLLRCGAEMPERELAKHFFKQAADVVGYDSERVTTEGHDSYRSAIRETLGSDCFPDQSPSQQSTGASHRGIKQRSYPMHRFASVAWAARLCRAFDEVCQFFRVRTTMKQHVSLVQQREMFRQRLDTLKAMVLVA